MKRFLLACTIAVSAMTAPMTAEAWWWPWNNGGWGGPWNNGWGGPWNNGWGGPWNRGYYPYYGGYPYGGYYPHYGVPAYNYYPPAQPQQPQKTDKK